MTAELFKAVVTSSASTKWPANTSTHGQHSQNPHEMIMHQPVVTDYACGLRVSRAVHEDCRGSIAIIRGLATAAGADGPGRPSRRVRILAPIPGQGWRHAGRRGGTGGAVRGRVGGSEDG